MSLITIILFFIYSWGLGFSGSFFLKNSDSFVERNTIRVGLGLCFFVVLGVLLNLIHIPLDWRIFLVLSLAYPSFVFVKKIISKDFKIPTFTFKKSDIHILLVFIVFFFCLFMYVGGAFKYPYLEDDDPWDHAISVKYVSVEKNFDVEPGIFTYINPYPPGYDLLLGVLHQTSPSINWTLKFFNGLIISLGVLFFYFFARIFTGNKSMAVFSTFVLAVLPSYFTHFIWAHSFAIALFFPLMYSILMISEDKRWSFVSMFCFASILLVQPDESIKVGIMMVIFFVIKCFYDKKFDKNLFLVPLGAFVISLAWWAARFVTMFLSSYTSTIMKSKGIVVENSGSFFSKVWYFVVKTFPYDGGTATRSYNFNDFFVAQPFGGINIHVGWGVVISLLVVFGFIYCFFKWRDLLKKENSWIVVVLFWFLFTFLGTNSMTFHLPVGLLAFRFWLLLAIPVALLSSLGLWFLFGLGKSFGMPKFIILLIIIVGVFATSGYQKYNQNHNAIWPPGQSWTSNDELQGYIWLNSLSVDTKVFSYSTTDSFVIGFDKYSCQWCEDIVNFRKDLLDKDLNEIHAFLKRNNYEYMILSGMSYRLLGDKFGENKTSESITNLLEELSKSNHFTVAYQDKATIILRVM